MDKVTIAVSAATIVDATATSTNRGTAGRGRPSGPVGTATRLSRQFCNLWPNSSAVAGRSSGSKATADSNTEAMAGGRPCCFNQELVGTAVGCNSDKNLECGFEGSLPVSE